MSDVAGGIAVLAAILLVLVTPIALSLHRRPPEEVVTLGSARGREGMAIHPWRGHHLLRIAAWLVSAGVTGLGLSYLSSSNYYAVVVVTSAGHLLLYLVWAQATGRAGDGSLTLTPEGIHQLYAGSEVFVPGTTCGVW